MPASPPPAVHLLGHYFNGTNETLRHLYVLYLTRELQLRARHGRGYNSDLGWTDVRRRARPAFGPSLCGREVSATPVAYGSVRDRVERVCGAERLGRRALPLKARRRRCLSCEGSGQHHFCASVPIALSTGYRGRPHPASLFSPPCVSSQGKFQSWRVGNSLTWQYSPKRKPSFERCRAHLAAASRVSRVSARGLVR